MKNEPEGKVESKEVKPTAEENEAHLQFHLQRAFAYSDQHASKDARIGYFRDYMEKFYSFERKEDA